MADQIRAVPRQRAFKERAFDEFKRLLVIFLYLWVVFGLLSIHKSLVLSQHHLDTEEHALAIINAFVFAKVFSWVSISTSAPDSQRSLLSTPSCTSVSSLASCSSASMSLSPSPWDYGMDTPSPKAFRHFSGGVPEASLLWASCALCYCCRFSASARSPA